MNLGIGRAAYEAALDYAQLRVQGGRRIIEHQAIGDEARRDRDQARGRAQHRSGRRPGHPTIRRRAATAALPDLPLDTIAQVFTSEVIFEAAKDAAECFGAMGVMRDMPLQKYVHDARICLHTGHGNCDAKLRIAEALIGYRRPAAPRSRRNKSQGQQIMDFSLSNEQRAWQMTARKFAEDEIRPISLERDEISDPRETFDWEIIKKGSKLGFRTMAVPKEWGGQGTDFVTQALVMAELAKADSAISKTFSQCWKWSHLIAASCTDEQKERFLKPFLEDDTFLLGKGISEPSAGSDNRLPPADDVKAGLKLQGRAPGRRMDPQRREVLHRQRQRRQAVLHRRAHQPERAGQAKAPPCSWCRATRRASASARCSTRAAGASTRTAR